MGYIMTKMPKQYEVHLKGCFIAGGAILSAATKTPTNDYDVYPKSNRAMIDAFYYLIEDNCYVVNISDRAVTFKSNSITNDDGERAIIQVMTYDEFETAEKIFEHFDFTVCMGAFDCDTSQHVFHPMFYPDIASKTLRFNPGTRYPMNSILRVSKYTAKGFFISKPEMIRAVLTAIDKGMPTSWEELESQIGGTYGREIRLRCEDMPFTIENALNVLADIDSFAHYETPSETYDGLAADHLEDLFSNEVKKVVANRRGNYFVVDDDTSIPVRELGDIKPKHNIVLNESSNVRLKGYKVLELREDGTFGPGIYKTYGKKVIYSVGYETEENDSPYLFVFLDLNAARNRCSKKSVLVEVSYDSLDLMCVSKEKPHTEIQVTKMRVEHIIDRE